MSEQYARIQVRKDGKLLGFLTPGGGTNRLKVHALWVPASSAEDRITSLATDNPGYEFAVQRDKK